MSTPTDSQTAIEVHDPATGELVGRVHPAGPDEVDAAVARARTARDGWARTSPGDRAGLVRDAAGALRAVAEELARLNETETGRPYDDGLGGVLAAAGTLEQYAELGPVHRGRSLQGNWGATDLMVPEPRGVAAVITPWNDPVAVAAGLSGAALVTGNTVVHKPSERCPHLGRRFAELVASFLPDGVLEIVDGAGPTGAALAGHADVDLVAHVGSIVAGRAIAQAAAGTGAHVLLENGGNDPLVVDDDVDPRWAAEQAALGSYANGGQVCVSVERIYVAAGVAEPFLDALAEEAARWVYRPGPGEKALGPLVDRRHRDHVHAHVAAAVSDGARVHAGGYVPEGEGAFYPATVLSGLSPAMAILREETFGPVAPVRVVEDFAQGLAEAIDDPHGLAATVLTGRMAHAQQAWRELPVGTVKINAVFGGAPGGAAEPRGRSGSGFGYGPELLDEMTTTKVVHWSPLP
ncbi:aldehyde dehydrogenase family protein [Actinomycetospora cinnamomea]|uniref:Acyl-CoA reductase-like NAD-dependent aldehyde dehydrogenase n=1 Tax=Actinomycetospora cinnamomea TaxID=663609 RepID=A0A2U1FL95_9PSEU|nr:aldehyde dehydrogenase family protein [Actinomycetospora cinnamomea]PVZ12896.1 acyl-CoA reductase-like NAD-dependent aldehyde dehydrogenase [Actinomycetospora cinnamomea]